MAKFGSSKLTQKHESFSWKYLDMHMHVGELVSASDGFELDCASYWLIAHPRSSLP